MKKFPCWLCIALLALVVSFWFRGDCLGGRVELSLDNGPRGFSYWWEQLASPGLTIGLGVKFAPEVYPCIIRSASVLVDSTDEFRIHIMDEEAVDLIAPATVSAIEPCTFAAAEFPDGITIESGQFYVLAEVLSFSAPRIATARCASGTIMETYMWRIGSGFFMALNAPAIIRAVVDRPVRLQWTDPGIAASNKHLFLLFDSEMDASTINSDNITIDPAVAGTWLYDDNLRRAEFVPDSLIPSTGKFYHIDVSQDVSDVYGNRLVEHWSGSFLNKDEVDEEAPAAPLSVAVNACDAGIEISWGGSMAPDTLGYYVYSAPFAAGDDLSAWLAQAEKKDVGNVTSARLDDPTNDVVYGAAVSTYDYCRNEGEAEYHNCVPHRGSVLLVVEEKNPDNSTPQATLELVAAIESTLFDCTLFDEAKLGSLPDADYLSAFDSVFWERGKRLWAYQFEAISLLKPYLQEGGRLYYDAWKIVNDKNYEDTFFTDWLHIEYRDSSRERFNIIGVPNDPIGDSLDLAYTSDNSFAASIAWFEPKDGAVGFLHTKDIPDEICALRYADTGDYGYRLVFSTAILGYVYDASEKGKLMSRGLCWLEGKQIDFRIASNTRVLQQYGVLQLFVSANTLAGVEADVDAYLAVMVEADGGSVLLFYDGTGFVSEMRPFVSGVHLESGMFLPRTKVLEYLYRGGLPSGKYTFFAALMQAGTQTFLTEPRSTVVFMK